MTTDQLLGESLTTLSEAERGFAQALLNRVTVLLAEEQTRRAQQVAELRAEIDALKAERRP